MATSPPSSPDTIYFSASSEENSSVHVAHISGLLEEIRSNKSQWAIGDQKGMAYLFFDNHFLKIGNVFNRYGNRLIMFVRNEELFFEKLANFMLEQSASFVVVELCGKAEAYLMYCHSKLSSQNSSLKPKSRVLLLGEVALVRGGIGSSLPAPTTVIASGTRIKLYGRTFAIQVSSSQHCIYLRSEDILKNRVRLVSKQPQAGEEDAATLYAEDDDSTDLDEVDNVSEEPEPESDTDAETSPAALGRAARIRPGRQELEGNQMPAAAATAAAAAPEITGNTLTLDDFRVQLRVVLENNNNNNPARPQRPQSH